MFTYDEIVRVRTKAPADMRPGELAWVIGIIGPDDGQPVQFKQLPTGIVYTVEFEDGEAIDIHESMLEASKTNAWDLVFHGLDAFVRWLIIFMAGAYSARWLVDNLTGFSLIFALLIWAAVLAAVVHYSRKT